tara:strand:- start:146 stop:2857 length:2712 start_codon:yes stop_codon:yes gene_type:complete
MPTLYNLKTNEPLPVADADVANVLSAGEYGVPKDVIFGDEIQLVSRGGDIERVDIARIYEAFDKGYTLESDTSKEWRKEKKSYEGVLPTAVASGLGFAEGGTGGVSSIALEALGVDVGGYEEHLPTAFKVSEGAGLVTALAGTALSGGLLGGLNLAGATALGAKTIGKGVAGTLAKKGLPKKIIGFTAEGALEGAAYSTGQELADMAKENAPMTAQAVMAAAGGGFVAGGVAGAVIPIVGKLFTLGKQASGKLADDWSAKLSVEALGGQGITERLRRADRQPEYEEGLQKFVTEELEGLGVRADTNMLKEHFGRKEKESGELVSGFYDLLDQFYTKGRGLDIEVVIKAIKNLKVPPASSSEIIGLKDKAIKEAHKLAIRSDLDSFTGAMMDKKRLRLSPYGKRVELMFERSGLEGPVRKLTTQEYDRFFKGLDISASDKLWDDYIKLAKSQKGKDHGLREAHLGVANNSKTNYQSAAKYPQGKPSSDAIQLNRDLGHIWGEAVKDGVVRAAKRTPINHPGYHQHRRLLDDLAASKGFSGEGAISKYHQDMNATHSYAVDAAKATARQMEALAEAKSIGANLGQAVNTMGYVAAGTMYGGPMAGAIAAAIGALAAPALRDRGKIMLAAGGRTLSRVLKQRNKTMGEIQEVPGLFKGISPVKFTRKYAVPLSASAVGQFTVTGEKPKGDTKKEKMSSLIGQIRNTQDDPSIVMDMMDAQLGELRVIAPDIADQITFLTTRKLEFLREKAPKRGKLYSKLQPYVYDDKYLNPEDMAKFERYLLASVDPMGAFLGEINTGSVSSETVETIKYIYPALLDEIRMRMTESMSDSDKPLAAYKMAEIAKVFEESMVGYQDPGFIRRQQAQYKKKVKQGTLGGLKKSTAKVGALQEMAQTGPQAVTANLRA